MNRAQTQAAAALLDQNTGPVSLTQVTGTTALFLANPEGKRPRYRTRILIHTDGRVEVTR